MGAKSTITPRLKALWRITTSKSATVITQKRPGWPIKYESYGQGDIRDMVTTAVIVKKIYNGLVDTINQAATEGGELHTLKEIEAAVKEMEKI